MSQKQNDKASRTPLKAFLTASAVTGLVLITAASAAFVYSVGSKEAVITANVNGVPVGCVRSFGDMAEAKSRMDKLIDMSTEGTYEVSTVIDYDFSFTNDPVYLTEAQCFEALWKQVEDDFCEAYMLYVDDRQVAAYSDGESLNSLIASIEAEILASVPAEYSDVKISSRLSIRKQICLKSSVRSLDEINSILNPLAEGHITARVASFEAASPAFASESADDDFTLEYNYLNTITVTEVIPFKTEYVDDLEQYVGSQAVKTEGADGAKTVVYELVYDTEGNSVGKRIVSETVISEAVNEVIYVGVAEIPEAVPTGVIGWPCERPKGVSSYYGWRDLYGKPDFHLGIDIPDKRGSTVWAADGGTVTYAGYMYSYGYYIMIEHSDGYSTLYAHLNSMEVAEGDKVYKGQTIGTIGNTGVAYGTHLHFEVRINNKTVDPMKYLPKD